MNQHYAILSVVFGLCFLLAGCGGSEDGATTSQPETGIDKPMQESRGQNESEDAEPKEADADTSKTGQIRPAETNSPADNAERIAQSFANKIGEHCLLKTVQLHARTGEPVPNKYAPSPEIGLNRVSDFEYIGTAYYQVDGSETYREKITDKVSASITWDETGARLTVEVAYEGHPYGNQLDQRFEVALSEDMPNPWPAQRTLFSYIPAGGDTNPINPVLIELVHTETLDQAHATNQAQRDLFTSGLHEIGPFYGINHANSGGDRRMSVLTFSYLKPGHYEAELLVDGAHTSRFTGTAKLVDSAAGPRLTMDLIGNRHDRPFKYQCFITTVEPAVVLEGDMNFSKSLESFTTVTPESLEQIMSDTIEWLANGTHLHHPFARGDGLKRGLSLKLDPKTMKITGTHRYYVKNKDDKMDQVTGHLTSDDRGFPLIQLTYPNPIRQFKEEAPEVAKHGLRVLYINKKLTLFGTSDSTFPLNARAWNASPLQQ